MYRVFLIALGITVVTGEENYDLVNLAATPGLYYERLEPLFLRKGSWRVVMVVETEGLFHEQTILDQIGNLTQRCLAHDRAPYCDGLVDLNYLTATSRTLLELSQEVKYQAHELDLRKENNMYPEPSTMRAKRLAPLGIIGTLGETLFGLATAEEVEKAHSQLKDLRSDQKQLIRIQKEQAHLVTGALARLRNETEDQRQKLGRLERILTKWNPNVNAGEEIRYALSLHAHAESLLRH